MILLTATTDKVQVVSASAGDLDMHASYLDMSTADPPVVKGSTSGRTNAAAVVTATTTDVVPSPAASTTRNLKHLSVRNVHASVSNVVTVQFNQNGTIIELHQVNLAPGEALEFVEGVGFFKLASAAPVPLGTNTLLAPMAAGMATDTYITNSALPLTGIGPLRIGRLYHWRFIVSKTAAGIATPILTVRVGTAGTTADAARLTFTWGAGTAAADRGEIELDVKFTAIGGGTSAILKGKANWTTNLQTTGLTNGVKALKVDSSGFDSTVAGSVIGLSYNGGTSAVHTVEDLNAYTDDA